MVQSSKSKIDVRLVVDLVVLLFMGATSHWHITVRTAVVETNIEFLKQQVHDLKGDIKALSDRLLVSEAPSSDRKRI